MSSLGSAGALVVLQELSLAERVRYALYNIGTVLVLIVQLSVERPAEKWPGFSSHVPLFIRYPYLLPTTIAAVITGIGAILTLFLSRDGGPRGGSIRLPPEKDDGEESTIMTPTDEEPVGAVQRLQRRMSKKLSGYFAKRVHDAHDSANTPPSPAGRGTSPVPMARRSSAVKLRTSRANGSAYGYGTSFRNRLASTVSQNLAFSGRRGSLASTIARRRESMARGQNPGSVGTNAPGQGESVVELNFAQRLLMANELAVNNIADLWVAAAMNVDNEEVFMSDEEDFGDEEIEDPFRDDEDDDGELLLTPSRPSRLSVPRPGMAGRLSTSTPHRPSTSSGHPFVGSPRFPTGLRRPSVIGNDGQSQAGSPAFNRRASTSVPAIFSHTGVKSPPANIEPASEIVGGEGDVSEGLEPIFESRPMSTQTSPRKQSKTTATVADEPLTSLSEKQPSLWSQLPIAIIAQYGLLALHSTTHDQVFLSDLVS